ncbi:MAG TPA: winged helix-turn-helix domain-containing protein [Candidatus Nitrosotalea sp.]|nr:winged helix-turn-helix domain-containing protein [Candidatus Nitrosotalea sp.]
MTKTKGENKFRPSVKIVARILKEISEHNFMIRTELAKTANVNYSILSQYLTWLEENSDVELIIMNKKVNVKLTEKGHLILKDIDKLDAQFITFID